MWSLLKKDLGEFVSTIKDDAIKSAMALGEGGGEEDYESSVRNGELGRQSVLQTAVPPPSLLSAHCPVLSWVQEGGVMTTKKRVLGLSVSASCLTSHRVRV